MTTPSQLRPVILAAGSGLWAIVIDGHRWTGAAFLLAATGIVWVFGRPAP